MQRSRGVEFIAIPVVLVALGVIFVLMLAADVGVWAWILVTAALIVVGLLAIGLAISRHRHPPAFDAPKPPPSTTGAYRVLVVADASLREEAFRAEIAPHAAGEPIESFVVAPALRSRLAHWTGDDAQGEAESHLAVTLDGLRTAGIRARGQVGSDDPIQAADDGLRTFPADEVVFVTGGGPSNWLEEGVLDAARERYGVRITHVAAGPQAV